jgi:hypothetical protein
MVNFSDPVTHWVLMILISLVMGTLLLITVAIIRRWQQIRYARFVHELHRQYRPVLAKLLSGDLTPIGINLLRELPVAELEVLLDPLFSRRRLTERQLALLQSLCIELGLIELWQDRSADGRSAAEALPRKVAAAKFPGRAVVRYLLRAKSIRNLGKLRHRPSWPLMVHAVNDHHPDIQSLALRSLGAMGVADSFPLLCQRLQTVIQEKSSLPPLTALRAAMANFDLSCAPALLPLLRHPDRHLRMQAMEILRSMVSREAHRRPRLSLTRELLTPEMVNLLLTVLAVDLSAEIRARAADIIVYVADPRSTSVLHDLLLDHHWFVRLHTVRALAHLRHSTEPEHLQVGDCLRDPHWQVRETAIHTLLAFGQHGRDQLYKYFLTSTDAGTRAQIVEVMERTGLMSALVEKYSAGIKGVDALMVEHLASETVPMGLSGILRTLNPEIHQKFLDRFLPYAEAKMRFLKETHSDAEGANSLQQILQFPPHLAA